MKAPSRRVLIGVGVVVAVVVALLLRSWFSVLGTPGIEIDNAAQVRLDELAALDLEIDARETACIAGRSGGSATLDDILNGSDPDESRLRYVQAALDCTGEPYLSDTLSAMVVGDLYLISDGEIEVNRAVGGCIVGDIATASDDPARTLALGDRPIDIDIIDEALDFCLRPHHREILGRAPSQNP